MTQKDLETEQKARTVKAFCEGEHGLFQHIKDKLAELSKQIIDEEDKDKRDLLWHQARCYSEISQHYTNVINNGVIAAKQLEFERRKEETGK